MIIDASIQTHCVMNRILLIAFLVGTVACTAEKAPRSDPGARMVSDPYISFTKERALEVVASGFNAGDGYGEVWIRDYNTFLELSAEVFEPAILKENLMVFFRMQGADGNIIDGFIPRAKAGGQPYDYIYTDLEPRYAGHKNTVETDQESSLVQAVSKYIQVTGDTAILRERIGEVPVSERLEMAMEFLMDHRYDLEYGLLWGATTADWGDVQPEHEWGVFLTEETHYSIDIYDNAMFLIALDNLMEMAPVTIPRWKVVREQVAANVRKHLWDPERKKFIPHLYLKGSPFPEDFNEEEIFYHGGTAVAIEAGLLSRQEIRASLDHMIANMNASGAASIGLTLYPAYPDGFFMNPSMHAYGYQNGGDWTWFGGRMIQQLVRYGFVEEAYEQLLPMVKRVKENNGFYEWYTVENQPRGSGTFRGSAGVLYKAIRLLEEAADEQHSGLPHIVIILVDDMGYGDPGCYNPDSRIPTPHIDGIAREGMRFTDAHAAGSLCHPSRYGLITGRYPFRTDLSVWRDKPTIEADRVTLPSMLRSQGYHTTMVGKWHLGFNETGYRNPLTGGPVDRGFDSFFGIRASTDIPPYFYIRGRYAVDPPTDTIPASFSEGWSPIQGAFWRKGAIAPGLKLEDVLPRFTEEAISVIRDHPVGEYREKPLMLYLAYPAPHTPWLPSDEFAGKSGAGMYGDFMMMVDAQIGRVISALDDAGLLQNSLLVITSDNGPVWYYADRKRFGHDSSGGFRGMKGDAWEAGHRMPFIVRWPGYVEQGSVSDQVIGFTDLFATLAEVTGAEPKAGAGRDSYSFLPVLMGMHPEYRSIRPPLVLRSASGATTIRSGDWKLIDRLGSGGFSEPGFLEPGPGDPAGQLYNLSEDPFEIQNLYSRYPDVVDRLQAEMHRVLGDK
jgi:arylsulfatase A-like enzyme